MLAWRRVKGLSRLEPQAAARAMRLAAWRAETAIRRNRPRLWILRDDALLEMARAAPRSNSALGAVDSVSPGVVRHHGERLLRTIDSADRDFQDGAIVPPKPTRPDPVRQAQVNAMKKAVSVAAGS